MLLFTGCFLFSLQSGVLIMASMAAVLLIGRSLYLKVKDTPFAFSYFSWGKPYLLPNTPCYKKWEFPM